VTARFERIAQAYPGLKLFGRDEVNPRLAFEDAMDPGAFLARLWAHFGPASERDSGFLYHLHDRTTGLGFTAFSGGSGPGYAGDHDQRDAYRPVLEAFEQMLDATTPVDCEHAYVAEVEHGGGTHVIGFAGGASFLREGKAAPAAPRRRR
jgi:hypothetical protein